MLLQAASGEGVVTGQTVFTTGRALNYGDVTFSFVVPSGVTSISAVVVGPGGPYQGSYEWSGLGGALVYGNDIAVTPGETLNIDFRYGVNRSDWFTRLRRGATQLLYAGQYTNRGGTEADGGGNGGYAYIGDYGYPYNSGGAGGAGGYTGNGGNGGSRATSLSGSAGAGGGGGGGANNVYPIFGGYWSASGGGGGVGLLGQGANGAGGVYYGYNYGQEGGGGGSGGEGGGAGGSELVYDCCGNPVDRAPNGGYGGAYGGASGGYGLWYYPDNATAGPGACRLIWPGNTRTFPNTNTGNL